MSKRLYEKLENLERHAEKVLMNLDDEVEVRSLGRHAVKVLLDQEQRWMTETEIAEAFELDDGIHNPILRTALADLQRDGAVRFKHEDCGDESLRFCRSSYAALTLGMPDGLHRHGALSGV